MVIPQVPGRLRRSFRQSASFSAPILLWYHTLFSSAEISKEHPDTQFAYEQLSVATMKYKARAMNAYLYASNLAHIPKQMAWNAAKRGVAAIKVKSAYTSQECSVCHYTARANRPNQQTFC